MRRLACDWRRRHVLRLAQPHLPLALDEVRDPGLAEGLDGMLRGKVRHGLGARSRSRRGMHCRPTRPRCRLPWLSCGGFCTTATTGWSITPSHSGASPGRAGSRTRRPSCPPSGSTAVYPGDAPPRRLAVSLGVEALLACVRLAIWTLSFWLVVLLLEREAVAPSRVTLVIGLGYAPMVLSKWAEGRSVSAPMSPSCLASEKTQREAPRRNPATPFGLRGWLSPVGRAQRHEVGVAEGEGEGTGETAGEGAGAKNFGEGDGSGEAPGSSSGGTTDVAGLPLSWGRAGEDVQAPPTMASSRSTPSHTRAAPDPVIAGCPCPTSPRRLSRHSEPHHARVSRTRDCFSPGRHASG